jgi:NADH-quinone oxidoreductase subunit I
MIMAKAEMRISTEDSETGFLSLLRDGFAACRNLFQRIELRRYPEESTSPSDRYRGMPRLTVDAEGELKCVACFLCETACPAECIRIRPVDSSSFEATQYAKDRRPEEFELDLGRCLFCGLCVEACPEEALVTDDRRVLAGETRADLIFDKERLRLSVAGQPA